MKTDIRVLVSTQDLQRRIVELGEEISRDYRGKDPILIGVLKGSFMFLAHLMGELTCRPQVDFIEASSYGARKTTSGTIRILKDLSGEIEGRHVIIVEDVLDSGLTLDHLVQSLRIRRPKSIEVCTLVAKDVKRKRGIIQPKYIGFNLPNEFIVGFGMDFAEQHRGLPFIGVLSEN